MKKYYKTIFKFSFYILINVNLSLFYVFRNNLIATIILSISFFIMFIFIIFTGAKKSIELSKQRQKIAESNKKHIETFLEEHHFFSVDKASYNKLFYFNATVVMETNDWLKFTPRKGQKRGVILNTHNDVLKYLKTIEKNSK